MLTPEAEEKGIFAVFSGRTIESIKDVEFSRNVSIIKIHLKWMNKPINLPSPVMRSPLITL